MILSILLLAAVTCERLGELWLARRNTRQLLAKGGREVASEHYPLIVILHGFWLGGLWIVAWNERISLVWLGVFGILQILRLWTLATLGRRWTTRIIVVDGEQLVTAGPIASCDIPTTWLSSAKSRFCLCVSECRFTRCCFRSPMPSF